MKLRLQLGEMLLASPKAGTDAPHGERAFGTAMEEMMATSASGKPSLVEMPSALATKQPQTGTHAGSVKADHALHISAIETQAANTAPQLGAPSATTPHSQAAEQRELVRIQDSQGQSSQNPVAEAPLLSEQLTPEGAKQASDVRTLLLPVPVVQELHASHSPADATLPDAAAIKHASSHAKRKAEAMTDEPPHPADGQAAVVLPVVLQPIDVVVPISTLEPKDAASQPDGLPSASLKPGSKTMSGHTSGQEASRQASIPAAAIGHSDLHATPVATPGHLTMLQSPGTAVSKGDKAPESIPSNGKSESSTKAQLTPQPTGRENASVVVAPNQAFHPQSAASEDSAEANAKQADIRSTKDAERKIASEVKLGAPGYPAPVQPEMQHQSSPNLPPPVTAAAEKAVAPHRPEAGASQVLQRMDLASSPGTVQLRMDARRLDVGVSSGSLGWVEVRATTSTSGRVDATLHVQNDASAQALTSQSREISDYAREHSVQLGQVSVGVGTGGSAQGQSHSTHTREENRSRLRGTAGRPLVDTEQMHHVADAVSLISVRA